jgi:hypothetical protein
MPVPQGFKLLIYRVVQAFLPVFGGSAVTPVLPTFHLAETP